MQINPYLMFNGNCRSAFESYARILGGTAEFMTYGESPAALQNPSDWPDRIIHARLVAGDQVLMASDTPPEQFEGHRGFFVSMTAKGALEAERIYAALADQAVAIVMPMQATFWSPAFGMLIDRFGTPWMVNCDGQT